MASKKIETLVPKVKREAPSCPESLIVDELRNTLIEFCISTDIYLQDLGILQVVKNVNQYSDKDLDIPVGAELNHIIDIFKEFSDDTNTQISQKRYTRIEPKSQIGAVSIFDFYGKGPVKYYTQKDQETILFAPTPTENEKLYVLYSLKPLC